MSLITDHRCEVCDEEIKNGEKAVQIREGEYDDGILLNEEKLFFAHSDCYLD